MMIIIIFFLQLHKTKEGSVALVFFFHLSIYFFLFSCFFFFDKRQHKDNKKITNTIQYNTNLLQRLFLNEKHPSSKCHVLNSKDVTLPTQMINKSSKSCFLNSHNSPRNGKL